jgi:hypothetical protein
MDFPIILKGGSMSPSFDSPLEEVDCGDYASPPVSKK